MGTASEDVIAGVVLSLSETTDWVIVAVFESMTAVEAIVWSFAGRVELDKSSVTNEYDSNTIKPPK